MADGVNDADGYDAAPPRTGTVPGRAIARPSRAGAMLTGVTIVAAIAAGLVTLPGGCTSTDAGPGSAVEDDGRVPVTIAGEDFRLEPAADDASRTQGLMHRTGIPEGGGMLFVWPDAQLRSFWMKNCVIPIDLIFVDPRGYVTALHEMPIEPPREPEETELQYELRLPGYGSRFPAQYAIELRAGSIEALGLRTGMRLDLDHEAFAKLLRD